MPYQTIHSFKQLAKNLERYTQEEQEEIRSAYTFAKRVHADQHRQSGEPYISHPLSVANIIAKLHLDSASVMGALLHDVVEDSSTTVNVIAKQFDENVAHIVHGLTKLSSLQLIPQTQTHSQNLLHLFVNMARDYRVMIIKLADRLHNIATLEALPREKQLRIANETISLYVPLAEKLGIRWIAQHLEDFAYEYKDPILYHQIKSYVIQQIETEHLQRIEASARDLLQQNSVEATIHARIKSIPSLYKKVVHSLKPIEEIYDLFGLRIICNNVHNCYVILGILHRLWTPLDGRFKDYIALPKANGYQSLHSTVLGPDGKSLEIQIRTHEMHEMSKSGVAAHWKYKDKDLIASDESFLTDISVFNDTEKHHAYYFDEIQNEALQDQLTLFTPMGDSVMLPLGSTALDFAFKIHTEIGLSAIAARINGSAGRLAEPLANTDLVEIITSKTSHPHISWLHHVATSRARTRIAHWINNHEKNCIIQGKLIVQFDYAKICKHFNQASVNLSVKIAQCCIVHPQEAIQATLRKNQNIEVHARNCRKLQKNRWAPAITAAWIASPLHTVHCTIHVQSAGGIFKRIEKIAVGLKIRVTAIAIRDTEHGQVDIHCTFTHAKNVDSEKLRQALRTLPTFISMQYRGDSAATSTNSTLVSL